MGKPHFKRIRIQYPERLDDRCTLVLSDIQNLRISHAIELTKEYNEDLDETHSLLLETEKLILELQNRIMKFEENRRLLNLLAVAERKYGDQQKAINF